MAVTPAVSPAPSPRLSAALPLLHNSSASAARVRAARHALLTALAVGALLVVTLGLAAGALDESGSGARAVPVPVASTARAAAGGSRQPGRQLAFAPAAVGQLGASIWGAVGVFFYTEAMAGLSQLFNLLLRGFGFQAVPLG